MTGRNLPADVSTAIGGDKVDVFWAVDLLFDSPNQLYFWSGIGDLVLDGNTYTGAGELLQISDIRESSDIAAYGATLTLSGIPSSLVSLALAEPYQGRSCIVKFGVLATGSVAYLLMETGDFLLLETGDKIIIEGTDAVTSAFTVFSGEMDQMTFDHGPETTTIALDVESRLIDLQRPRIRRYTHTDQITRFPNDMFFEFNTRIQTESLEWGG